DREPAELADDACGLRRDHAVHGGGEQGKLEAVGPEHPRDVDVVRIARAPGRHDRDVVEPVGPSTLLALANLEFHHAILWIGADGNGQTSLIWLVAAAPNWLSMLPTGLGRSPAPRPPQSAN